MVRKSTLIATAALSALLLSGQAVATAWVIGPDLNDGIDSSHNLSYDGVYSGSLGVVSDGGSDGFDGMGYLDGDGSLSIHRRVDVLQGIDTYRWVDTFTNDGTSSFSGTVRFRGNLGSDIWTSVDSTGPFSSVSHEEKSGGVAYDPVFGIVWGNNAWASSHISFSRIGDIIYSDVNLMLDVGESISIAHFVSLMRPDGNYNVASNGAMWPLPPSTFYDPTSTIADVQAWADAMVGSPYLTGLDAATIASIANFDPTPSTVPEPAVLALMGIGLAGIGYRRRGGGKTE